MRAVSFDPTAAEHSDWYDTWQQESQRATEVVIAAWEIWLAGPREKEFQFGWSAESAVWTELKNYLVGTVFLNRCAYCELEINGFFPDAEHFRPKGKVTVKGRPRPRVTLPDGSEIDHPGYFWLAFDWCNLVPSCKECNSGKGKGTQFPVQAGHKLEISLTAALLDQQELPYLLHPLNPPPARLPKDHITYGVGGIIAAKNGSELGGRTIEVLDLRRDKLRKSRQRAQEQIRRKFYGDLAADATTDLKRHLQDEPHPSAAYAYLLLKQEESNQAIALAQEI